MQASEQGSPDLKAGSDCPPGEIVTTNNPQCETCVKLMKQRDDAQARYDKLLEDLAAAGDDEVARSVVR